jgi:hypothetical protein
MRKLTTLLLAGALGLGFGARAMADEGKTAPEHQGESVSLTDLPKAAQDTLNREAKGGQIEEVRKETGKDGKVKYEAEIVKNGQGRDIKVSEAGKVLERGKAHDESKEPEKSTAPEKKSTMPEQSPTPQRSGVPEGTPSPGGY